MGNAAVKKRSKLNARSIAIGILLVGICIHPLAVFYQVKDSIFSRSYDQNYQFLKTLYYNSQYVKKVNPSIIPDQDLEAFAGGAFLKGMNPILIVHDHPPLGRYITSASIVLFDNAGTLSEFLLVLSAIAVFLLARKVTNDLVLSLLAVGIFINEPLFISKFIYEPLLEPVQLPFLLFAIYAFMQGVTKKHYTIWFIITAALIGCTISIQFFIVGVGLTGAMLLYFISERKFNRRLLVFICSLPLALVVLLLSYFKTIQDGSSIVHIFGIQKYIFLYHKSQFVEPLSFWDLLFFNRWHTWWGTRAIASDPQWIIAWPIATFATMLLFLLFLFKKVQLSPYEKIILLWLGVICAILSTGNTSTRYFLPILPMLYIMMMSLCKKIYQHLKIQKV